MAYSSAAAQRMLTATSIRHSEFGLKMPIHAPFLGCFWGIWPPRWDTISTNLTKVSSTGHCCSSGIGLLLMLVSVLCSSFRETAWTKKVWRRKSRRRTWIFGRFWRLFKVTWTWLFATFLMSMCSFCGGQHTDTNIWSILPFHVF